MVFAPFLECCGDAVMFAKQNAAHDDDDDVSAMTIVFLVMKLRWWVSDEFVVDAFGMFSLVFQFYFCFVLC
jgi:hypothetical protein